MKKIYALNAIAGLVLTSSAFAGANPQTVNLCLTVKDNISPYAFTASFVSSDVLDFGNKISAVQNGQSCVSHTYNYGPKNIKFAVNVSNRFRQNDILFIPDPESCLALHRKASASYETPYIRTNATVHSRSIILSQAPPVNGFKYAYYMHCQSNMSE